MKFRDLYHAMISIQHLSLSTFPKRTIVAMVHLMPLTNETQSGLFHMNNTFLCCIVSLPCVMSRSKPLNHRNSQLQEYNYRPL